MSRDRKVFKAVTVDYADIESYSDDDEIIICLTPRQAIALAGHMRMMYWETRWQNLPPGFDLFEWVSEIEFALMGGKECGDMACCSELKQCLCEISNLINLQLNIEIPNLVPVIPPDDPAQNLPGLDPQDFPTQQRLDAALCDISKLTVESVFEGVYQGQLEKCANEDNDPPWGAIFTGTGGILLAAIGVASGGTAIVALFAAGAAFTAVGIGDFIFDYNILPDNDCGDLQRVPVDWSRIYGCQLWEHLRNEGISYSSFQTAYACQNTAAITYYRLNIEDNLTLAEAADAETRDLLSSFLRNGDFYQSFMMALNGYAENVYSSKNICSDCAVCDSATTQDITTWDDPRIVDIQPPPDVIHSNQDYQWPTETDVYIEFDQVYCFVALDFQLVRGATSGSPDQVCATIGDNEYCDSAGSTGSRDITIDPELSSAKIIVLRSGPGPYMRLNLDDANKRIRIRSLTEYADCT